MDPGHKAMKNPSDNADLGFQAVGSALRIMQLNVEGLSAAKRHIIESLAEIHHTNVINNAYEKKKCPRVLPKQLVVCDGLVRVKSMKCYLLCF